MFVHACKIIRSGVSEWIFLKVTGIPDFSQLNGTKYNLIAAKLFGVQPVTNGTFSSIEQFHLNNIRSYDIAPKTFFFFLSDSCEHYNNTYYLSKLSVLIKRINQAINYLNALYSVLSNFKILSTRYNSITKLNAKVNFQRKVGPWFIKPRHF